MRENRQLLQLYSGGSDHLAGIESTTFPHCNVVQSEMRLAGIESLKKCQIFLYFIVQHTCRTTSKPKNYRFLRIVIVDLHICGSVWSQLVRNYIASFKCLLTIRRLRFKYPMLVRLANFAAHVIKLSKDRKILDKTLWQTIASDKKCL